MRVTKRTNIAMRVLMYCEVHNGGLVTKAEIARRCNASENHLAHVINQLAQAGYLYTQRGRHGGLSLAKPAHEIKVGDIFRIIEAPVPLAECFADTDDTCPLVNACRLRGALSAAAEAFFAHLDKISLDELVCDNGPLTAILNPAGTCDAVQRPVV